MEHRVSDKSKLRAGSGLPADDLHLAPELTSPLDDPPGELDEYRLQSDAVAFSEVQPLEPLADFAKMDFGDDLPVPSQAAGQVLAELIPEFPSLPAADFDGDDRFIGGDNVIATDAVEPAPVHLRGERRFLLTTTAPSWLISLLVHVAILLILAAISLDPINNVISILKASASRDVSELENFDLQGPMLEAMESPDDAPLEVPTPSITPVVSMPELQTPLPPDMSASMEKLQMNALTESILPTALMNSSAMAQMSAALNSRSSTQKSEMLEKFGGNAASEQSVARALKWISEHQASNGGWTFEHTAICGNKCGDPGDMGEATNGATAMALLPFLGAGQTHLEGLYKDRVKAGLAFLINRMKVENKGLPQGSWHEPGGSMYSHGLAAITICEAYAMTQDPDLLQPAQLALNYLINAQDPRGGGWRYSPGQPGDTSVVGWAVMALKSGKMGHLVVPQRTFLQASSFLDFVSVNDGAYYGYTEPSGSVVGREATTAVGLLCRMYLGVPKEHPGLLEGIKFLSQKGPSTSNLYYSYYATQVLRHHGGPQWETWNKKMRDELIKLQAAEGHASGSWYTTGPHSGAGGRLYATSLATMILEVYYRHMPLYSEKSSLDDFEI